MTNATEDDEKKRQQAVWAFRLAGALVALPALLLWLLVAWLVGRILFGQVAATPGAFVVPSGLALFAAIATLLAYFPFIKKSRAQ